MKIKFEQLDATPEKRVILSIIAFIMKNMWLAFLSCFLYTDVYSQVSLRADQFFNKIVSKDISVAKNEVIVVAPKDSFLVLTDLYVSAFYSTTTLFRNSSEPLIQLTKGTWFQTHTGILLYPSDSLMILSNHIPSTGMFYNCHLIGYKIRK